MRRLNFRTGSRALPVLVFFLLLTLIAGPARAAPERITVYAAASLTDVIGDAAEAYRKKTGTEVRQVYAASSVIARQIVAGAPADVMISANAQWMNYAEQRGLLEPGSRRDLARNRLVVIVPADSPVTNLQGKELGRDWIPQRLAVGEIGTVPAGIYAREALTHLGRMNSLRDSLIMAGSVRVALTWVARSEVDAGMVYASDAAATGRVRTVWTIPDHSHTPIRYPAAVVKGRPGAELLNFLAGDEGRRRFAAHGFLPPAPD